MKKNIIHIISLAVLTLFYGCSNDDILSEKIGKGKHRVLTLTLKNANLDSRTSPGKDELNENLINRVDLFIYGSEVFYKDFTFNKDNKGSVNLECEIPNTLFTNSTTKCEAYVIINRPIESEIPDNKSIDNLKKITISSELNSSEKQREFVMDGSATLTVNESSINGTIYANRSTSKITLTITSIENELEDGNNVWKPLPGDMQVMFYNGVNKSQVNATAYTWTDNTGYFNLIGTNTRTFNGTNSGEKIVPPYNHEIPFYSYPSDWGETASNREAHMILMLPWTKDEGKTKTNFYYEVPINEDGKKLVRNTYYQINLVVGILGSTELTDEIVKLNPTCILLNWGEEEINAELDQPRYLVAEDVIKIYNQNSVTIPFESSHDVEILNNNGKEIITYHPDLSEAVVNEDEYTFNDNDEDGIYTSNSYNQSYNKNISISVNNSDRNISYVKTLNNTFNDTNFDFTEYRTVLTIRHIGETGDELEKQITIIQYPAIYGEAEMNTDYKYGQDNSDVGFVWVNGYQGSYNSNNPQDFFSEVDGTSSTTNCPNRLIFNVTSTQGTNYIIGDPRTTEIDESLKNATCKYRGNDYNTSNKNTAWVQATALYDNNNNRGLKYYYPTDVDYTSGTTMQNSRTLNMIAPRFMVSSAYGAIDPQENDPRQYLDAVRKRCASYQEDGYPAGRWRLPTAAELKFLVYLDNGLGYIPNLYANIEYWSAHGYGVISGSNVTIQHVTQHNDYGNVSVRCVYDLWYWEDRLPDSQRDVFTWGDYPRNAYPPTK